MGKILSISNQKGGTSKSSNEYDYIIIDSEGIDERLEGVILEERVSYLIRK